MSAYAKALNAEYKIRFNGLEKYRQEMWSIFCNNFFQKFISTDSTVLDVGAGYGEFIFNIKAKNKIALDLNTYIKDICIANNIRFLNQDCTKEWELEKNSVDIVFSSNFLEHLYYKSDIDKVLKQAYKVLKKDGKIILLGPNIRFVYDEYWDFWDHHLALSDRSIREVLKMNGFKIEKCIDKFLPYAMSGEGRKITPPLFLIHLYLKIPLAWKILGKQFLIIAKK